MKLDITKLNNRILNSIEIDEIITIPESIYEKSNILNLKKLNLKGQVFRDSSDIITLQGILSGIMIIEDSISLEPVEYPFTCEILEEIEENFENLENILDITDILWQNIVLEVPLKFTKVENFDEYQGDGWKLVDENSIHNTNNPFSELKDMMREE